MIGKLSALITISAVVVVLAFHLRHHAAAVAGG